MSEQETDTPLGNNRGPELMDFINAIIALEAEKASIAQQIKAKYAEARAAEFDDKAIKATIKLVTGDASIEATEDHRVSVGAYLATFAERIENEPPELNNAFDDDDRLEQIRRLKERADALVRSDVR